MHRQLCIAGQQTEFEADVIGWQSGRLSFLNDSSEEHAIGRIGHDINELRKNINCCTVCGKMVSSRSTMLQHMWTHSEKAHRCQVCGNSFTRLSNLRQHLLIHQGEKPYKCKICGREFRHQNRLKGHKCGKETSILASEETQKS